MPFCDVSQFIRYYGLFSDLSFFAVHKSIPRCRKIEFPTEETYRQKSKYFLVKMEIVALVTTIASMSDKNVHPSLLTKLLHSFQYVVPIKLLSSQLQMSNNFFLYFLIFALLDTCL